MEFAEVMLKRRSIRKFTTQPVSDELVTKLLHYGMAGPSACNRCPWEFYVITSPLVRKQLRKGIIEGNYDSPLIIIVAGNEKKALPLQLKEYWIQDCSAAIENILLGATDLGLGTCWCGISPQKMKIKKVQEILTLPEHIVPLGMIHVGYPSQKVEPRDQYNEAKIHYIK